MYVGVFPPKTRPRFRKEHKYTSLWNRGTTCYMDKERITRDPLDNDSWICVCDNRPIDDGFYPCDEKGNRMELDEAWIYPLYVCGFCGRIIDSDTLEVVGRKD